MAGPGQEMANVNFSRYSSAVFKVAQKEVWRVFEWLHHHHYHGQPPAYVGQRLRESEGGMKRIGAKERAALERQDDPDTMDIPLLYRLLQHTCGLRQEGPEFDWTSPRGEEQRQSLEHQLYLIKEARNRLCHHQDQYMHLSDHKLDALLQELQGLLCHSLRQAGQRSGRPTGEVDKAVASVKDRLTHIQASVPPSATTPQEFALLARRELREQQEGHRSAWQRLSAPLLRWAVNAQVVTLDQLLQAPGRKGEEPPRVLPVLGEAGIGKTSLCRQVVEAWLQGDAWLQDEAVEVVVMVELRQVFTRDLTRLLQEDLLPQTCLRCQPGEVLRLLGALRVLWLLDGFEEASADARELLRRLVKWCGTGSSAFHMVVVTCQSEYMKELKDYLGTAATLCCVTHCGLTEKGLHSLLATQLQGDQEAAGEATEGRVEAKEDREGDVQGEESAGKGTVKKEGSGRSSSREAGVEARCQAFLEEVVALDPNLLGELHNPLKLVLTVQLFEEGHLREVAGASLTQLYAAIQDVLVAKLVARLRTKSSLTEAEGRERLRRWVAALCEVALAMWSRGRFVALDEAAEQLLQDRAIDLQLPYTDCFSVFLTYRQGLGPRHGFLHRTQQSVLAAQHVQALLLQDYTSQELVVFLLPGQTTTTTTTLDPFLNILVHAAASLATKRSLSEGRAKVLAELLQQCRHCPWLEVLQSTACCPALAQEVRPRLTEEWKVTDSTVQAAAMLAAIQAPASITIILISKPDSLPHLMLLLHCLAKAPVKVTFWNPYSFSLKQLPPNPTDSLLLPLCDPASLCRLVSFTGVLSAEGCRALWRQQLNLVSLHVGVLEPAALEELVQLSHNTMHLMKMVIELYNIFKELPSKSVSPRVKIRLCLMNVKNEEAKAAVALACRISHRFEKIILGEVSALTVCRMVKAFEKEGVHTPNLARIVFIDFNSGAIRQSIHCFPLPRPANMSLNDVLMCWKNFTMQVFIKVMAPPWVAGAGTDINIAVGVQGGADQ